MIFRITLLLYLIFIFQLNSYANTAERDDNIVACIDEYPPYQTLGNPPTGSHITALILLAKTLKKELIFSESPNFARCVKKLELGQVDVIVGLNSNPKRDRFSFYAPYKVEDSHVFIYRKTDSIDSYQDLNGKIIGVPRGTTYFKKFDQDSSLKKISIASVSIGIELLLKQRIDVIITSEFAADLLLNDSIRKYLKATKVERKNYKRTISYFGFSKKNKLNLTEKEIVELTTAAFEQGVFISKY